MSGDHAELLAMGVQTALEDTGALQAVYRETADGKRVLIAEGYEMVSHTVLRQAPADAERLHFHV